MVSSIKRKVSQHFSLPSNAVSLSLEKMSTWAAIGQVLQLCTGLNGTVSLGITAPLAQAELTALLKAVEALSFAPPQRPDWSWVESPMVGGVRFYWKSSKRPEREVAVVVSYNENIATFSWDTGTEQPSQLIHDTIFGLVKDEEVLS